MEKYQVIFYDDVEDVPYMYIIIITPKTNKTMKGMK